jgi:hypothetical protein
MLTQKKKMAYTKDEATDFLMPIIITGFGEGISNLRTGRCTVVKISR